MLQKASDRRAQLGMRQSNRLEKNIDLIKGQLSITSVEKALARAQNIAEPEPER